MAFSDLLEGGSATGVTPTSSGGFSSLLAPSTFTPPAPVAPAPVKTGFLSALGGAIKQTGSDFVNAFKSDASTIGDAFNAPATPTVPVTPTSYLTDIYGTMGPSGPQGGIVGNTFQAWTKAVTDLQSAGQQTGVFNRGTGLAQAGLDAVNAFFTPISTVFSEAATIPGPVGTLANAVNKGFMGLGNVGGNALANVVQKTPALTPQQKATLTPLAQNIGALTMQIIAGKASADTFGAMKDATHSFLSNLSEDSRIQALNNNPDIQAAIQKQMTKTLPVTSETPTETPVPIKTGEESAPPEPYTPPEQLPTIQMGPKATSELPTIQTEPSPSENIPNGTKLVPETSQTAPTSDVNPKTDNIAPTDTEAPQTAETTPNVSSTAPLERPVAPDGTKVTKAANDINQTVVNAGMDKIPSDQMSKFTTGSYKDSAAQGEILKATNPDALMKMATTGKDIPSGVHPQILYNIAEAHAEELFKATKDPTQLMELAKSPLATQLSEAGSTMGSHGFNDNPNSSTRALQRANEAISGGEKGKVAAETQTKTAKTAITKTASKLMDYNKIIDAIKTC